MLRPRARQDGDHYVINGGKWFITGADGAAFAIIMAKREDGRATMFLADMDQPGHRIVRAMDSLDRAFPAATRVVRFEDLRVPAADVLGEIGKGFRYAQVRLAPARLTHCMRWLGAARRAHDIARDYAREREAFGKTLGEHEGVGFMLADNEMDLRMSRLAIWHTAWLLDQGARGSTNRRMAKVVCSEAIWRVVDRCVQVLGGQGVTGETVVARIFADMRASASTTARPRCIAGASRRRSAATEPIGECRFRPDGQGLHRHGAGRGIGRGMAEGLARHGAHVVLTGRTRATLDEAAEAIGAAASVHTADVSKEADVLGLRDTVLARHGKSTCWSTTPA